MSSSSFEFLLSRNGARLTRSLPKGCVSAGFGRASAFFAPFGALTLAARSHWKQSRLLCIMDAGDGSVALLLGLEAKK
jgi:hypothetical protein